MANRGVQRFEKDVLSNRGYLYTTNARRSSVLANQRLTQLTRRMVDVTGKAVVDVGCGDGTYTYELFMAGRPASIVGVDAAAAAVELARSKYGERVADLRFETQDVYAISYPAGSFDVAIVRGLLHHLDDAERALRSISRLARHVFIIEPNGYSPILKAIERFSSYHREHGEKSYSAASLRRWIGAAGGTIEAETYAGLVPMFCPDWMANALKRIEPAVEPLPGVRQMLCAVYAARFRTALA